MSDKEVAAAVVVLLGDDEGSRKRRWWLDHSALPGSRKVSCTFTIIELSITTIIVLSITTSTIKL